MKLNSMLKGSVWALLLSIGSAHAITGPEVAQLLNQRFQDDRTECAGATPAFYCSGVLVRSAPAGHIGQFWQHSADSVRLGGESVGYLRADLGIRSLGHKNGVVFADPFTAISQHKSMDVLCAYPFVVGMQSTRPGYGCGLATTLPPALEDPSSCASLGIGDAASWVMHFQQQGLQPARQCSFSSRDPRQFHASLQAHTLITQEWSAKPNELMMRNWDATRPARLAVQGLFYDVTQSGAMPGAQKDQRDYFIATGEWLPILRMDLREPPGTVFGFDLQDQLYIGYRVASSLNARFADTAPACRDNKPGFYCNGVLIRAADASASFRAWNPSPNSVSRNGVSFSYVRKDVGTIQLAGAQGFIFREQFAPVRHPATLRCSYPVNAGTNGIPNSCRADCASLGVTTVATWQARYGSSPGSSCAFGSDQAQFQLNIAVRAVLSAASRNSWNEIIIAAWPQNIPRDLPLEALFYVAGSAAGLANAQFIQRDYYSATGRYIAIVSMTLTNVGGQVFSYVPQEQTTQDITDEMLLKTIKALPSVRRPAGY